MPSRLDGIGQFLLCVGIESATRLVGIGTDAVAGNGESAAESVAAFEEAGAGESSGSGSAGADANVWSALLSAASTSFGDALFDFVEEAAGDARFVAGRSVEGDRDTVCDGFLIPCQIRDDGVKGKGAEVPAEFRHVTALVRAAALEAGDEVAEEM